jgi:hypothetical protein
MKLLPYVPRRCCPRSFVPCSSSNRKIMLIGRRRTRKKCPAVELPASAITLSHTSMAHNLFKGFSSLGGKGISPERERSRRHSWEEKPQK